MAEHTLGLAAAPPPWGIVWLDEEPEHYPAHIAIVDSEGEEVATIVHRSGCGPVPEYKWQLARLIAAAPELLRAARALVDCQHESAPTAFNARYDTACQDARAAIAKARGA